MTEPNRFCAAEHASYLAAVAVHLLRDREARYPAAIERGAIGAEEAARKLELMRCIVAQWRWIADSARPPLPPTDAEGRRFGAWNTELALELDAAAAGARRQAERQPDSAWHATFAQLVDALAWAQRAPDGSTWTSRVVDWAAADRRDLHARRAVRDQVRAAA